MVDAGSIEKVVTGAGCCRRLGFAILAVVALCASGPASAQTADTIRESLTPKPLTRSLRPDGPNAEEAAFLRSVATRSIRIEQPDQRAKLAAVVQKAKLPKIDLTINFDYDSDAIRSSSLPTVIELGKALIDPAIGTSPILLNGHTDGAGGDAYNVNLSERRAASVKAYLVAHFGIKEDRLLTAGSGRERLKNTNDPLAAENRRVEIVNLGVK